MIKNPREMEWGYLLKDQFDKITSFKFIVESKIYDSTIETYDCEWP